MKNSFEPIINPHSKVLILGTLPGEKSIEVGQYYANPNNQFWRILASVYERPIGITYTEKLQFLSDHGLALWDVLKSAERYGSLDNKIRNEIPNDFSGLLQTYPNLKAIGFNGKDAEKFFRRHVLKKSTIIGLNKLRFYSLSSTSRTHTIPFDNKVTNWKVVAQT